MKTPALELVLVHVADIDVARAFYTEKLGLEAHPTRSAPDFVLFERPGGVGAWLALSTEGEVAPSNGTELWWYVENADAAHDELVAGGVVVASPLVDMPFGRTFSIKDPSGNVLNFVQAK